MDRLTLTLVVLDYAAVAVFGATGALAAARRKHDIVTFGFFAAMTGVGGGTLRDVLIDAPVFWVLHPSYLVTSIAAGVLIWFAGWGRRRERLLNWLDALGVAAYSVFGAVKAMSLGVAPLSAIVMGVMTATFGGIIRDVLAEQPSVLLRREVYITAALAGASTFAGLQAVGLPGLAASFVGFLIAFGIRAGAILFHWSLPGFPGRAPPEPR